MVTCVGWQVVLCDPGPIWQVTLCSSVVGSNKELYTPLPLFTFSDQSIPARIFPLEAPHVGVVWVMSYCHCVCRASIRRLSLVSIQAIPAPSQPAIHQDQYLEPAIHPPTLPDQVIHRDLEWSTHPAPQLQATRQPPYLEAIRRVQGPIRRPRVLVVDIDRLNSQDILHHTHHRQVAPTPVVRPHRLTFLRANISSHCLVI